MIEVLKNECRENTATPPVSMTPLVVGSQIFLRVHLSLNLHCIFACVPEIWLMLLPQLKGEGG